MNTKESIQVIGRMESRPCIKDLKDGKKIARFKFRANETKRVNGKFRRSTTYHKVIAFNKLAEKFEELYNREVEIIIKGQVVINTEQDRTKKTMIISDIMAESLMYKSIIKTIDDNKIGKQRA